MRGAVWLKLPRSGEICSSSSDEADGVSGGTGPPVGSPSEVDPCRLAIACGTPCLNRS